MSDAVEGPALVPADVPVVVLAGGLGTRIRHLVPDAPKPMAVVKGRPFIAWVCDFLRKQGFRRVRIATGYRSEVIAEYFAANSFPGLEISCSRESEQLGTAGGVLHSVRDWAGPKPEGWLVCNGDSLVLANMAEFLRRARCHRASCGILGVAVADASRYGTLETASDGRLFEFAEKKPGAGIVNAGVYFLGFELMARMPPQRPLSLERDVFPRFVKDGVEMRVHAVEAPFIDIGVPESLVASAEFVADHRAHLGS
jgi:D-glycero-alpha-D-manno-heptose 1-phosphate guanylyltransferase